MNQPRRSEFLSSEQRSDNPFTNTPLETYTPEQSAEDSQEEKDSSSNPSLSSSGYTISSSSEITGSNSITQPGIEAVSRSESVDSSPSSSGKSIPFEDEDLSSDTSSTFSTSSGSDPEISRSRSPRKVRKNGAYKKADEQCTSEDFETVFSEDDSNCSEALAKVGRGRNSKEDCETLQTSYPQTYYRFRIGNSRRLQQIRNSYILRRFDYLLRRMSVRVARYHKELCIVFLIFASGLASLRSTPPKIRSVSVPGPFFEDKDASFFIQDNYMGEYVDLANKQIPYHPAFLFYYAPWDSESVAARSVFLSVAKHFYFAYHGRIKFYAINCWWPGGQCRKNYRNLSHYPIFVAHIGKSAGIIYNGPVRVQPMVKFLSSLLKPVTRIDTEDELWSFRAQHDVIMLGYFNFTQPESAEAYETYLQMALRTFEADPFNQVGFGLFLRPELAEKFFLSSSNAISLVLFNEIHTAKWHGGYHAVNAQNVKGPVTQVAEWIIERTKNVPLTWVYALRNGFANRPAALGPLDFAHQLTQGPVLLLVSRRYFPSGHSPFYMQVKEVALDYFNCNRSGNVTKLRRTSHKVNSEWAGIWGSVVEICQHKGNYQCQQLQQSIQHWIQKRFAFKRESLQHYENASASINFTGLSCISERQFKFLAIDPVDVPYFINLGLSGLKSADDDTKYRDDPMAFIIDSQNDVIMPLPSLNITDMAIAIHNYTLLTENGDFDSLSSQLFLNSNSNESEPEENEIEQRKKATQNSVLENWGSEDLLQYLKGSNNSANDSVLILYTASFCGYCAIAVTHVVALSRFIEKNYGNESLKVKLVKIDTFKNSLPPELSPEELPTVIFVPSWNRTDIKMYPANQEISSLALLRFILSELEPGARVQASLMSPSCGYNGNCGMTQDIPCQSNSSNIWTNSSGSDERLSCIKSSRSSVSSQIELLLQRLQNGEEVLFDTQEDSLRPMTTQAWNGQLLDRLRTMAVTLDVS